ncbi:MAG TPA: S41 family peptidase [Bryobacteraceae bacterium]|jgi:tricorn protease
MLSFIRPTLPVYLAFAFLFPATAPAQVKLLRHPTYSKGRVAFSYLGDIWVARDNGTEIQRLTDNKARDVYPRFSPDGSLIAFSSNRDGNYDVFVVPVTGGKPKQLTFHTADDNVVGWTPDGKKVLFTSVRGKGVFPTITTLFEVGIDGGTEQAVPTDWGASASYSPDGKHMAFTRHPSVWSRKHYRGSYAADLWVQDVEANTFNKLGDADFKGNYLWPMYGANGEIYFVSDRTTAEKNIKYGSPDVMKSVNNIWKISVRGGAPVQVTHHTDGNLYFPSISEDRKTIVYEDNFGLWKLDVASGKSSEIRIDVKTDSKENDTEWVTISNDAEGFHLSPSNRRAAVVVHGEIFTIATDRGEPQRVTETSWREQYARWSPNGKWIAFVSDRTGRQEVWISDELGKTPRKLSDADCEKTGLVWAPDSKSLLWSGSDHKLRRVETDSGKTDVVASGEAGNVLGAQFSPDGKWLAYSKEDKLLRSHVWVKNLESSDERMIASDQFQVASNPKWTPDGKKLLLIGGVTVSSIASLGFRGTPSQLYSIPLTRVDKAPDDRSIDTEEQAMAALNEAPAAGAGGSMGPARGSRAPVTVKIEWDGLGRRIKKVTSLAGSVFDVVPAPDSRSYAVVAVGGPSGGDTPEAASPAGAGPSVYIVREDSPGIQRLNTTVMGTTARGGGGRGFGGVGSEPQWSRDGRSLYMLLGRGIYSIPVPASAESASASASLTGTRGTRGTVALAAPVTATSGVSPAPRQVSFAVRMQIDRPAERKQVFEEAWRTMKDRFYDASMHGVNWAAAQDKYESLLEHVADADELHNVIMEMIGELNASHTGISGGGGLPGEQAATPMHTSDPGFTLEPDPSGYYKVGLIDRKGPADHEYFKLATGSFIISVNGEPLKTTDNYWRHFNILPGRKLEFRINSKPAAEDAWTVAIEPLSATAQSNLEYDLWVANRRQMVQRLTNGEIGYLHIRAMDAPSFQKFQEDLIDNRDKKALIIDQRFNGGGGIDQELLEILNQRKQYQVTRRRDSLDVPRPSQAFFGPMVVLQNERSASDAEMFPDGFRRLGLGKLVGVPTMGAVIGTGSYTLLDGSQLRTPGSAVFTAAGEDMENFSVQPDVLVDNGPADFLAGRDRQVEKAIEVLRAQLK